MSEPGGGADHTPAVTGLRTARRNASLHRLEVGLERLDLERMAIPVLAVATIASALVLFYLTRGSSFWGDDWVWITTRRANTIGTFLAPYDGHLSLLPLIVYRIWFAVFGIDSYAPYRVLVIGLSLIVGSLTFEHARHRVGRFPAALVGALALFVGSGWQDTMWAFQIGWLLALGLGLGALIMLDRRTRAADLTACALMLGSICSTSFGIAFALGIAFDVALTRRRWRAAWIPLVPLGLYAIWALYYHPTGINWSEITLVPTNLVETFAGGAAGILGLSGVTSLDPTGTTLTFGAPLVALLAAWAVRCAMRGRFSVRAGTLVLVLALFSTLTTLGRAFETPLVSRYVYPDCVLIALLAVELARGARPSRPTQAVLAGLTLLAIVANIGVLRSAGDYLRQVGAGTNADMAAIDLGRGSIPSTYIAAQLPDYPFVSIQAGLYYAAERALGTPADTLRELLAAPAGAQTTADHELIGEQSILLSPGVSRLVAAGSAPRVVAAPGGTVSQSGPCLRFAPAAGLSTASGGLVLRLAAGAVRVTTGGSPVAVAARRFGPTDTTLGTIGPGRSAIVLVRQDSAPEAWTLTLSGDVAVQACMLG